MSQASLSMLPCYNQRDLFMSFISICVTVGIGMQQLYVPTQ